MPGGTPLRGFQFARVAMKKQDKMRGGFRRALRRCRSPPRGKNVGLRGSAWHCFFLFCFVHSLRGKKKKEKRKGGKKKVTKGGEKGRVGGTSEGNVMFEGGRKGWDKCGQR